MGKAWRTDHRTLVYIKGQEATPSRAVRSCTTGPSRGQLRQLNQQHPQQQHMPTQPGRRPGAAFTPVDTFYRSLRQEEAALDLDRLHVLKIRNREAEGAMTKDKFSKYSPLPDISKPQGRPLLRQKTYDVIEPVYVKGPPPPPSPKTAAPVKEKPPPPRTADRRTKLKEPPRRQKLPVINAQPPPPQPPPPPVAAPAKKPPLRRPVQFRPQELSKDILPQSPTAFWFPI